jgi:hypothetical protein
MPWRQSTRHSSTPLKLPLELQRNISFFLPGSKKKNTNIIANAAFSPAMFQRNVGQ